MYIFYIGSEHLLSRKMKTREFVIIALRAGLRKKAACLDSGEGEENLQGRRENEINVLV